MFPAASLFHLCRFQKWVNSKEDKTENPANKKVTHHSVKRKGQAEMQHQISPSQEITTPGNEPVSLLLLSPSFHCTVRFGLLFL